MYIVLVLSNSDPWRWKVLFAVARWEVRVDQWMLVLPVNLLRGLLLWSLFAWRFEIGELRDQPVCRCDEVANKKIVCINEWLTAGS